MTDLVAGNFTVPGSTGSFSVTGLGLTDIDGNPQGPDGVFFFGSNVETEDAVTLQSGAAIFYGCMGTDYASATLLSHAVSASMDPRRGVLTALPIYCVQTGATTADYAASATSLDSDGFTVNFTSIPGAGTRKVHYLAWWSENSGTNKSYETDETVTPGWRAQTLMDFGAFDDTSDGERTYSDTHWLWIGGRSYPIGSFVSQASGVLCSQNTLQGLTGAWHESASNILEWLASPSVLGTAVGGTLNVSTPGAGTDFTLNYSGLTSDEYNMQAFWDGPSSAGTVTPSETLNGTVTNPIYNLEMVLPKAVLTFNTGEVNDHATIYTSLANIGIGVATETYQGCVFIHGLEGAYYQSATKSWCCDLLGGTFLAAQAGTTTVAETSSDVTFTTTVADASSYDVSYVVFGDGFGDFRPHIYRYVFSPGTGRY